jgi:hypothetical protein
MIKWAVAIVIGIPFTVAVLSGLIGPKATKSEVSGSDVFRTHFEAHRMALEKENQRILASFRNDGGASLGPLLPNKEAGYRGVKVDCPSTSVQKGSSCTVLYIIRKEDCTAGAATTGVAWLDSPPQRIAESFDRLLSQDPKSTNPLEYGRLDGHWYSYYSCG